MPGAPEYLNPLNGEDRLKFALYAFWRAADFVEWTKREGSWELVQNAEVQVASRLWQEFQLGIESLVGPGQGATWRPLWLNTFEIAFEGGRFDEEAGLGPDDYLDSRENQV